MPYIRAFDPWAGFSICPDAESRALGWEVSECCVDTALLALWLLALTLAQHAATLTAISAIVTRLCHSKRKPDLKPLLPLLLFHLPFPLWICPTEVTYDPDPAQDAGCLIPLPYSKCICSI